MLYRLLIPVLILCAVCGRHTHAQSTEPIDSKHIYGNADLVMVFQIKRLENALEPENKAKLDSMHGWLLNLTKLDTAECEEVILQFGDDEYENPRGLNKYIGFVFRGEDDIPQEQIDGLLETFPFDEQEHNERTFYTTGREPGFYFSDNSLLIGETPRVCALIDTEAEALNTREVPLLENTNRNLDICAYVDFSKEEFHAAFEAMMSEVDTLQESDTIERLTSNAKSASLQVDLEAVTPVRVEFEPNDSADLDELEAAAKEFVTACQEYAVELKGDMLGPGVPSPEIAKTAEEFCDSLVTVLDGAEVSREGDAIVITIDRVDESKKLVNDFVGMMSAVVDHFGG